MPDRVLARFPATSVGSRLRLLVVGACVVPAAVAMVAAYYAWNREAESRSENAIRLIARNLTAGRTGEAVLGKIDHEQFCLDLVGDPLVLAARVFDATGGQIAAASKPGLAQPDLPAPEGADQEGLRIQRLCSAWVTGSSSPAYRVDLTLPSDGANIGPWVTLVMTSPVALNPGGMWILFPAVLCAVALVWGWRIIEHSVDRPLSYLASELDELPVGDSELCSRVDEWGNIGRQIDELEREVYNWRGQARQIEQRLHHHSKQSFQQIKRIQRDAWEDRLTGVHNRRFLDEKFPEIFAEHKNSGCDLSVIMFDLDHFKKLNDTCGHSAGDRVLAFVGELLKQCLRADDLAVRYGGDEFLLILPGISPDGAVKLARRLMAHFAQRAKMMVSSQPSPRLTAGIASLHQHGASTPGTLLALADHALCKAKQRQRGSANVTPGLRSKTEAKPAKSGDPGSFGSPASTPTASAI